MPWAEGNLSSRTARVPGDRSVNHGVPLVAPKLGRQATHRPWAPPTDTPLRQPKDPSVRTVSVNPEASTGDSDQTVRQRAPEEPPAHRLHLPPAPALENRASRRENSTLGPIPPVSARDNSRPAQHNLPAAPENQGPLAVPGTWSHLIGQQADRHRGSIRRPTPGPKLLSPYSLHYPPSLLRAPEPPRRTGQFQDLIIQLHSTPTPPIRQSCTT